MPMKPTLYMIVGLPGSGKTTRAKEIEAEHKALRLCPDEWIVKLHGYDLKRQHTDALRHPIEQLQWEVAKSALVSGTNVVLEWGFWSKSERGKYRNEVEKMGVSSQIVFMDVGIEELWSRISSRPESQAGTLHITRAELEEWARSFEPPDEQELLG